jgi:hypothetical protein
MEAMHFPLTIFIDYTIRQKCCGGQNLGFLWNRNVVLGFLPIRKTFLSKNGVLCITFKVIAMRKKSAKTSCFSTQ